MDDMTRTQFVMLTILVSFVTSIFTGIVIATLVSQAPTPITQTVNKVIEKTMASVALSNPESKQPSEPQQIIVTQEDLVVKLVENTSSAVVSVVATKDIPIIEQYFINPFEGDETLGQFFDIKVPQFRQNGTEKKQVSSGTGFFVSGDGFVLTSKHVVVDIKAEYSIITNDGTKYEAKVLARDPLQDLAILKIEPSDLSAQAGEEKFNYIPLANSDKIKVGQTVVAIGNTLGEFQNTVSIGIVSGLNRTVTASGPSGLEEQLQEIIQTDAAISPGNSGGPLLDLNGRVVGINTAIAKGAENVGFALPINIAKKNISDIKEFGEIKFAYLGVYYSQITESFKEEKDLSVDYGVLIIKDNGKQSAIIKDSPAEKVGLIEGDIVLEFNGIRVDQENILGKLINNSRVGQEINLKILRDGEEISLVATLDERPKEL